MVEPITKSLKEELIETYNLGTLREEYEVTRAAVTTGVVLTALGLLIYGVLFGLSLSEPRDIATNILLYGLIPLATLSGIGVLVLFLGNRWVSQHRNWRISVYEHGLIYNGKGVFAIRWSSVKTIVHKITAHTSTSENGSSTTYTHTYTITCYDGTELRAKGIISGVFAGKDELIQTIEQESAPYLLEEAINSYKTGDIVHFGALDVNQVGIILSGQTLEWPDLKSFAIKGTVVSFWKQHKLLAWKSCELGDVINYEVFTRLMSEIQSGKILKTEE